MQSTDTILTILVTVIGVFAFLQLVILFAMFLALRKGMRAASAHALELKANALELKTHALEIKGKVIPILEHTSELLQTTKGLVARLEPKIEAAAGDVADMTRTASAELKRLGASADEITDRVRRQAARVDGITTNALNGVDRASQFVGQAVSAPVRQFTGIVAAAKAVIDTLRTAPTPPARPVSATEATRPYGEEKRQYI